MLAALPKFSVKIRQHRLEHTRIDRSRRVVIEVNHLNTNCQGPGLALGQEHAIRDTVVRRRRAVRLVGGRQLGHRSRRQRLENAVP